MLKEDVYEAVEIALENLGLNPLDARGDEPGQWMLVQDFVPIYLDVWEDKEKTPWNFMIFDEDATVFQLSMPFVYVPTLKRDEFLKELLTVNLNLHFCKFSFNERDNVIAIIYRKPGIAVWHAEIPRAIASMFYYYNMVFEVLKDEFALKRVIIEAD